MNHLSLFLLIAGLAGGQVGPPPAATPYVAPPVTPSGAAVEQTSQGTKPGPELVEGFDGLGLGFAGPQGTTQVRTLPTTAWLSDPITSFRP